MPPPLTKPATPTLDAMKPPSADDNAYKGADAVTLRFPMADKGITLYQRTGDAWKSICNASCSPKVDPHGTYMVGGFMIVDSPSFALPPGARDVTVRSKPTFTTTNTLGWTFLGIGVGVAGVNAALYETISGSGPEFLVPIAIGTVFAIIGAGLLLDTTSVEVTSP
jgi:hypothetical protein